MQGSKEYITSLVSRPRLLDAVRNSLEHLNIEIRRAASLSVQKLAERCPRALREKGFDSSLVNMIGGSVILPLFEDREVQNKLRIALALLQSRP